MLAVSALVAATWLLFVGIHLGGLALFRGGEPALLGVMAGAGSLLLWRWMGSLEISGEMLPPFLKSAAVGLYWAGCIGYVEILSLLSRGISFRVLIDLMEMNGAGEVEELKLCYGEGMGLKGLLQKRLDSLRRAGLVRCEGNRVGPLTPWGRLFSAATFRMRGLLRLEEVG